MADAGFRVDPQALKSYGNVTQTQGERVSEIRSRLASVTLSSSDFGHLPDAQHLFEEYQAHASAEQQNLSDLVELLGGVVTGLHYSAQNYEGQETATAAEYGGGR